MAHSKIKFVDWAYAVYLQAVSLKGVSSMRLYHELGIGQQAAWFMAHRIREAYEEQGAVRVNLLVHGRYLGKKEDFE